MTQENLSGTDPFAGVDMDDLSSFVANAAKQSHEMVEKFMAEQPDDVRVMFDPLNLTPAFMNFTRGILEQPEKLMQTQMNFFTDYMKLMEAATRRAQGHDDVEAIAAPARGDRRFKGEAWESGPFDFFKQFYLLASNHVMNSVTELGDLDEKDQQKVAFFTRQYLDAMSPSNFVLTNPDVLQATLDSKGSNLVEGMQHLLEDLERGKGMPLVKMTDFEAFEVGENLAVTPGKVVFRNRLFELIQYSPTTDEVYATPLLIFPPWINKYYILDLTAEKSFVRWAVSKGYTVFVVSWVNPTGDHADMGFEAYLKEGYVEALSVVQEITGEASAHTIGYCVAGTFLSIALAYLKATGRGKWVRSATFFTAQVDFSEAGELSIFIDPEQLKSIEKQMEGKGYLDKRAMAMTFNMLRSNDLIWSYVVNNYLMGKEPVAFDLLYWNCDSTNLSQSMHTQYLKNMYLENNLIKPGKIVIDGIPIDLTTVDTPAYVQAGRQDHIAPPQSVYKITEHFKGPIRFLLAGSGHIAGVVNPPEAKKYQYWTNDETPATLEAFVEGATETPGSWWGDWHKWLSKRSGKKVTARDPDRGPYPVISDAPGDYVRVKND